MKVDERWGELKEESHANIQSGKGILNRQIRSIQTEGHFGDIKENEKFRRFDYRSTEKVYFKGKTGEKTAWEKERCSNRRQGFCISYLKKVGALN